MKFFSKFKNFQKDGPAEGSSTLPIQDETLTAAAESRAPEPTAHHEPAHTAPPHEAAAEEHMMPLIVPVKEARKTIDLTFPEFSMKALLTKMVEIGASDLHFETGSPPIYRIKGDMAFVNMENITKDTAERCLYGLINDSQRQTFNECGNLDFAYEIKDVARFRANFLKHHRGIGGVFRIIPSKIPTADELRLPEVIKSISMSRKGIILVTGPTGSGKSTTMASMINHINRNKKGHIITIEDPVEFTHQSINCLITHREVGHHTLSFADALRAALREDPDVILVGELRDLETISLALTAAQMGVLVMGTLHTNNATKTIDRMIDVFPAKQQEQVRLQLSQSLRAIIAQQLLKTADGKGRTAAIEILIANTGLSNIIREGKTTQIPSFITMGKSEGMQSMDTVLVDFVKNGIIKKEDALLRANDMSVFKRAGLLQ
ncbi:MAG: type IV pilus twitching motility protein PilT [Candidatus Eremiobacteraeota bacterium]|nr:type IV pilus twitching motility protein PilT [Candidatus Eremiobacteraeota bacterium]